MQCYDVVLSLVFAVMAVVAPSLSAPTPPAQCNNRTRHELHQTWATYHADSSSLTHESFYMVPEYRGFIQNDLDKTHDYNIIFLEGDMQQCNPSSDPSHPLSKRSHCPWYYVMNHDPHRYPDVVVEARSQCIECLNGQGRCEQITYPVPVLRQTGTCDSEGYHKYEEGWHSLVVGYTCVATTSAS